MKDGKCTKQFPKSSIDETQTGDDYEGLCNGTTLQVKSLKDNVIEGKIIILQIII